MFFIGNVCRTCNTEDSTLVNIFAPQENQAVPNLAYMLEYCTQTKPEDNSKYPQGICYNCIKQLEISYRFLKRFRLAQNEFNEAHIYLQGSIEAVCNKEVESEVTPCQEPEQMRTNLNLRQNKLPQFIDNVKCQKLVVEIPDEYLQPTHTQLSTEIHESGIQMTCFKPKLESSQAIICHICHKSFFTAKALNLHLKINHKQKFV